MATPPLFHVTDLGTIGSADSKNESLGYGINDYGQVVGASNTEKNAFLWTPTVANGITGSIMPLGSVSGYGTPAQAYGINNFGQVVGITQNFSAFLWTPTSANGTTGSTVGIGTIGAARAYDINSSGQVTLGTNSDPPSAFQKPSLWTPTTPNGQSGSIIDLGIGAAGGSYEINNLGQVTGKAPKNGHGFAWTPTTPNTSTGSFIEMEAFQHFTTTSGINSAGSIVGTGSNAQGFTAILWRATDSTGTHFDVVDLGRLVDGTSQAFDINDAEQIVGTNTLSSNASVALPFLWTQQDGMLDLSTLTDESGAFWDLQTAQAINNLGQIAGGGYYDPDGSGPIAPVFHAFLLTPVPEPSTFSVLTCFASFTLVIRRRQLVSNASKWNN